MISLMAVIVLAFFVLISYFDIKEKAIYSVIMTSMVFITFAYAYQNIHFGILGYLFGLTMRDFIGDMSKFRFGMADIKSMAIIGVLIPSIEGFLIFIGVFAIFQFAYTVLYRKFVSDEDEMPFIPCLAMIFLTLLLSGVVA